MSGVEFVDYQEPPSVKVGRFLLSKGFGLADSGGMAVLSLTQGGSLGILLRDPEAKPRKHLFGLIKQNPRRIFLGSIWFNKSSATENWVFLMYGRKHVELVRKLAEEIASAFKVKITLRLIHEQSKVEVYLSDYDY